MPTRSKPKLLLHLNHTPDSVVESTMLGETQFNQQEATSVPKDAQLRALRS